MKTIFFGTPSVAVPFLEILSQNTDVQLVITQPDRPKGRGLVLTPCPVKQKALELNLPVLSPEKLKDIVPQIAEKQADLGICVAFGKIFRKPSLESIKRGIINIHFSLLPKYRGASPVQSALFNGETKTGITLFKIDEGMDTGEIISQKEVDILPQDDAETLFNKLIEIAKIELKNFLDIAKSGDFITKAQEGTPTIAPLIEREKTFLNFTQDDAITLHNKVRALAVGAPSFAKATTFEGQLVQILKTEIKDLPSNAPKNLPIGAIVSIERNVGFFVQCKSGVLFIKTLRPSGKGLMSASAYINGKKYNHLEPFFR